MAVDYKALKQNGFMRQKQGDVFSVRVRVIGGNMTSEKIAKVGEVSQKFGKGYVHLTSRQSVEIPYIKLDDIEAVKASLAESGLTPAVCGAGVRTITACHGDSVCSNGTLDTYFLAEKIDKEFSGCELPHKFKIGITGCIHNCLKAEENDIGIKGASKVKWDKSACVFCGACEKACKYGALTMSDKKIKIDKKKCRYCGKCADKCPKKTISKENGYLLYFGGLFGKKIYRGKQVLPFIQNEDALMGVIDYAMNYYKENGKKDERFGITLERTGWDEFTRKIKAVYEELPK
ncbi:MAG TPA: 4Fe-4S binding protein [Clostridiales bacterium]|nr:4Fe-4S binding protein [Clostridiales bacterium]